jgi:hypothetical protein
MCFSTSTGIDGPTINGLVLPVKAFTMLFDHFVLILFLQREAKCKCDNTDNNENAIKVCQELTSRAFATRVHNLSGFEGSLPHRPLFHTFISGDRWPLSRSCGYELVTKRNYECILVIIFLTIHLDMCICPSRSYVCPDPPLPLLSQAFMDLAMNSSLTHILQRAR